MTNYWLTVGETIKHSKYGIGKIIKANNLDRVWAMQNVKTNEIRVLGMADEELIEVLKDD